MNTAMKFGFVIPWADAEEVGDLAAVAEDNGWDGIFMWEPVWGVDTWISLALAAVRTSKIRLRAIECRLCFRHGGFKRRSVLAAARETGLEPAEGLSRGDSIADRGQLL